MVLFNNKIRQCYFAVFLFLLIVFPVKILHAQEECLKNAWSAYNQSEYINAIMFADQCIDNFKLDADNEQDLLIKSNIPFPPEGIVSGFDKKEIFDRHFINDVATSYFIKGSSAEYLYNQGGNNSGSYKTMAMKAYQSAIVYKHARTWDPKGGWFWSPGKAAAKRLPFVER